MASVACLLKPADAEASTGLNAIAKQHTKRLLMPQKGVSLGDKGL
jgi:hypothetical protein